jgi:hypothetical protein
MAHHYPYNTGWTRFEFVANSDCEMKRFLSRPVVKICVIAGTLLWTMAAPAAQFYMDDGSVNSFGGTSNGDCLSLNHFNTGGATVMIDQISVLWNPLSSQVHPAVALYSDPNGDGNPSDMVLLTIQQIYIPPNVVILNNTTLQSYSITPTLVTGSFFVGEFLSDRTSDDPMTGLDSAHLAPYQSWIIENSIAGGMNLQNPIATSTLVTPLDTFVAGNFMLRANYTVVPEPGTLGLASLVTLIMVARNRRVSLPGRGGSV